MYADSVRSPVEMKSAVMVVRHRQSINEYIHGSINHLKAWFAHGS